MAQTRREHRVDRATRYAITLLALAIALVFAMILGVLLQHSLDAFESQGIGLVTGRVWDPVNGSFGAWPFIFGTLFTSGIAIVIAVPIGFLVALFLTELSPGWLRAPLGIVVELLAGVPSIVYGMWGLFALAPLLRDPVGPWLKNHLGTIPSMGFDIDRLGIHAHSPAIATIFQGPANLGLGFLLAGLVLAIMILPTVTSIARDALLAVPRIEREAAYALGATRWEVARTSMKSAKTGLFAAGSLGLGRALGETIAVTLVIGNVPKVALQLFQPGQTIASTLATQINEATEPTYVSALIALGLILFVLTLVVNLGARLAIERPWRRAA